MPTLHTFLAGLAGAATLALVPGASAESTISGDLARKRSAPLESLPGVDSHYGVFETRDGLKLRTITTRPEGVAAALPGVYFVQWLSCDGTEQEAGAADGWSQMLQGVITRSNMVMRRTEKAGTGDSEGDCGALDYETDLAHHRQSFADFIASPGVDPERVFVFGASMGGNMAPLVAQGHDVAGVIIWGGGAKTWFERMLGFDRRAMERGDTAPGEMHEAMKRHAAFHTEYLVRQRHPDEIAQNHSNLADVWNDIIGTGEDSHYGRPIAFHHQAQAQNWPAAWDAIEAPVLVLYGEYDWFEDEEAHALVANIANRDNPGAARLVVFDKMDHHFSVFPDARAAFRDEGGTPNAEPVVKEMLQFLERHSSEQTR
jgi:pimeloyl-ACP methyl ester carboxylesterase